MNSKKEISHQERLRRMQLLERARSFALSADFKHAQESIEEVLEHWPQDLEALRLEGNVLEQEALERNEFIAKRLAISPNYIRARACYEAILAVDPKNTCALVDLGDHFLHMDAFERAQSFYSRALELLKTGEHRSDWREEVSDLHERAIALTRGATDKNFGRALERECERLLDQGDQ